MRRQKLKLDAETEAGKWCNVCGHIYKKDMTFIAILTSGRSRAMSKIVTSSARMCATCLSELNVAAVTHRIKSGIKPSQRKGKSK